MFTLFNSSKAALFAEASMLAIAIPNGAYAQSATVAPVSAAATADDTAAQAPGDNWPG